MARRDLNLLVALDALLSEGSVARAAERLRLSPSATSRALARLREVTGDPLLVRAGRGLVPTPRAMALRGEVGRLLDDVEAALRPAEALDLSRTERTFTLRTSDGFVETFGPALIARVAAEAPGIRLRFVPRLERSSDLLRAGEVDLETGVIGPATGPEVRTSVLFQDRFVGVVRPGHPLAAAPVTAARYAAARHVFVSRRGLERGPVDEALAAEGLTREIVATVGGFATALSLVRASDLVASVPERQTGILRDGLVTFALPVALPALQVLLLWHPRLHADPAHRWLRERVRELCLAAATREPAEGAAHLSSAPGGG